MCLQIIDGMLENHEIACGNEMPFGIAMGNRYDVVLDEIVDETVG